MLKQKNVLKVALALAVLAVALGVLIMGPLAERPEPGLDLQTPSMENIPQGTHLKLEVQPLDNSPPGEVADEAE